MLRQNRISVRTSFGGRSDFFHGFGFQSAYRNTSFIYVDLSFSRNKADVFSKLNFINVFKNKPLKQSLHFLLDFQLKLNRIKDEL